MDPSRPAHRTSCFEYVRLNVLLQHCLLPLGDWVLHFLSRRRLFCSLLRIDIPLTHYLSLFQKNSTWSSTWTNMMPKLTRKEKISLKNLMEARTNRRRFHLGQNCRPKTKSHSFHAEKNILRLELLPDFANFSSVVHQAPPIIEPVHLPQLLERLPPHSNYDFWIWMMMEILCKI